MGGEEKGERKEESVCVYVCKSYPYYILLHAIDCCTFTMQYSILLIVSIYIHNNTPIAYQTVQTDCPFNNTTRVSLNLNISFHGNHE